ncbi:hypothetical protein EG856_01000 [Mycoplasmopsis phocirhinis]|uniref:Uncharacterized protein n=1 Tax=Mycoplasmopsis phocirhinis TaxID=142650 RepID=A0A4P6MP72_9BACT|nr:hypothetical protein [Mycoplasmopsis phocirhinis]QBF34506.1 hypothetical protein EG856_01000 [Mycoplasmopsis phocirhinis]
MVNNIQFKNLNIEQKKIDLFIKRANNKFLNVFWVILAILLVLSFILLFTFKSLIDTKILIICLILIVISLFIVSIILNYIRTCFLIKKANQFKPQIWTKIKPTNLALHWDLWWGLNVFNLKHPKQKLDKIERKKIIDFFKQIHWI